MNDDRSHLPSLVFTMATPALNLKSHVEIRDATKHDCKDILAMLKELAEYEKLPDKVRISEEALIADGFGEDRFFHALIAEIKDSTGNPRERQPIGYALYFYTYSTWDGRAAHLEDIFVRQQYRNLGVGTLLLKRVAKVIQERGCVRLDLSVLDWNKPSIGYYEHFGAYNMTLKDGWHLMRFEKKQLTELSKTSPS